MVEPEPRAAPPPSSGPFGVATAVAPVGGGSYRAEIADGWDIVGNTNGGYLLSLAGRAMCLEVDRPDPVTLTAHYLSPARPGRAQIDTQLVRAGRRFATVQARLRSDDRDLMTLVGTFGDLGATEGTPGELVRAAPPDLPAPEDCAVLPPEEPTTPAFWRRVDVRMHPDDVGFMVGRPSGTPRVRGWFSLRDDEPADTIALLTVVDAFPPTVLNSGLAAGWTPTLELTAHVRGRPVSGWLACSFESRFVNGGFIETDGEIWDASGRLVAQSRQLALVPKPSPSAGQQG